MEDWEIKPVQSLMKWLSKKPKNLIVADFGCGEGEIGKEAKQKVHSFDLVALHDHITECDMSNVPLENESLDIVIFCLSLMGTNYFDYLLEANRVLKNEGILKIAEVESRFVKVEKFQDLLIKFGFELKAKHHNGYFITFEFIKRETKTKKPNVKPESVLKPCLYKKR